VHRVTDLLLLGLLFVAIAIGWLLGRRGQLAASLPLRSPYYEGLQFLLDDRTDSAADAFIDALEVNEETLETYLALGVLMRKRGETDRAIRIHQKLLARGKLSRRQVHNAHLELARDYLSAGLLDRAERLLQDLARESDELREVSLRQLLDLYQGERDWGQALAVGERLLALDSLQSAPQDRVAIRRMLAHCCCEMAIVHDAADEVTDGLRNLQRALAFDANCVRASLLLGRIELGQGRPERALRALRRVRFQSPDFVAETLPLLQECHVALGDNASLKPYLEDCVDYRATPALIVALAEEIERSDGPARAAAYLAIELARRPSLVGLSAMLAQQQRAAVASGAASQPLDALQPVMSRLLAEQPTYRCKDCGFSGRQLHWQCPGCRHWDSVRPLPVHTDD